MKKSDLYKRAKSSSRHSPSSPIRSTRSNRRSTPLSPSRSSQPKPPHSPSLNDKDSAIDALLSLAASSAQPQHGGPSSVYSSQAEFHHSPLHKPVGLSPMMYPRIPLGPERIAPMGSPYFYQKPQFSPSAHQIHSQFLPHPIPSPPPMAVAPSPQILPMQSSLLPQHPSPQFNQMSPPQPSSPYLYSFPVFIPSSVLGHPQDPNKPNSQYISALLTPFPGTFPHPMSPQQMTMQNPPQILQNMAGVAPSPSQTISHTLNSSTGVARTLIKKTEPAVDHNRFPSFVPAHLVSNDATLKSNSTHHSSTSSKTQTHSSNSIQSNSDSPHKSVLNTVSSKDGTGITPSNAQDATAILSTGVTNTKVVKSSLDSSVQSTSPNPPISTSRTKRDRS